MQIDQGNNNGSTPLWLAAQDGHLDIVRFLVEVGAAIDQGNNNGVNALVDCSSQMATSTLCDF